MVEVKDGIATSGGPQIGAAKAGGVRKRIIACDGAKGGRECADGSRKEDVDGGSGW